MKRPFCSTPTAHPGEPGLSHCAKMRSTFGFRGNGCAPAVLPAASTTDNVATLATRVVDVIRVFLALGTRQPFGMLGFPIRSTVGSGKHFVSPYGRPVASTPVG